MNQIPKSVKKFALLLIAVFTLIAITGVINRMNHIREREELIDTNIPENAPPIVAFTTIALGSFRGLVADFLWLRSNQAKEQGNYFEMVQLASWIVKLQPRFTEATAFLAWNMAYNVSVTFSDFEDRWRWVQRGIELIRDEALLYNPGDPTLYKELGWLYQHKLGQEMDDANRYYKFQLARQMMNVLGRWPVDWERLAESPPRQAELFEKLGEDAVAELNQILRDANLSFSELETQFRQASEFPPNTAAALQDTGLAEPLEYYLRQRWLRQRYKLDAAVIHDINLTYGELDWRLPEAHAVYWATLGLEKAEDGTDISCERMIFQALSGAFRGGRLIYLEAAELIEFTPNIEIVDGVKQVYLDVMERHGDNIGTRAGYENFLIDATVALFVFGHTEKAAEYLRELRREFAKPEYRLPLNRFALRELAGDIRKANYNQAQGIVQGYLFQMYNALAFGDIERAEALDGIARTIWRLYMEDIAGSEERRGLPPYNQMKRNMYQVSNEAFPPELAARLTQAVRIHGALPDEED